MCVHASGLAWAWWVQLGKPPPPRHTHTHTHTSSVLVALAEALLQYLRPARQKVPAEKSGVVDTLLAAVAALHVAVLARVDSAAAAAGDRAQTPGGGGAAAAVLKRAMTAVASLASGSMLGSPGSPGGCVCPRPCVSTFQGDLSPRPLRAQQGKEGCGCHAVLCVSCACVCVSVPVRGVRVHVRTVVGPRPGAASFPVKPAAAPTTAAVAAVTANMAGLSLDQCHALDRSLTSTCAAVLEQAKRYGAMPRFVCAPLFCARTVTHALGRHPVQGRLPLGHCCCSPPPLLPSPTLQECLPA